MSLTQRGKAVILATFLYLAIEATALPMVTYGIKNHGTIRAIGISFFQDQACTTPLTEISWGLLSPGENASFVGFCKNTKTISVTLTLQTQNWSPSNAADYIRGSWNYTGATISRGQVIPIAFSVAVAQNITGITDFSFEFLVTATG